MINKVLLLYPPLTIAKNDYPKNRLPLGLAYIAGVLCKKLPKLEVAILDSVAEGVENKIEVNGMYQWGLSTHDICEQIKKYSPDMIGISSQFSVQSDVVYKLCRLIKLIDKNIIIVIGGAHPTANYERMMAHQTIDYIIKGEGEYPFLKLIKALNRYLPVNDIEGLVYRVNNKVKSNVNLWIKDLDSLPIPAYHLLNMELYKRSSGERGWIIQSGKPVNMISSRGCPFNCVFCGIKLVAGKKFRPRSAKNVLKEIDILVNKYGFNEIHFEDDNLTLDYKRAEEIFDGLIKQYKGKLTWAAPSGIALWTLDENLISKMKESGCTSINIAIESGDEFTLKEIIKKPLKLKRVKEIVALLKKYSMHITGFWVIGLPGETRRSIWRTLDYCRSLKLDNNQIAMALPYKGTELYNICKSNNLIKGQLEDSKITLRNAHIKTKEFSPELIKILVASDRFIVVNGKDNYKCIPFRLLELIKREGWLSCIVLLEVLRHYTLDKIITKPEKRKVYFTT